MTRSSWLSLSKLGLSLPSCVTVLANFTSRRAWFFGHLTATLSLAYVGIPGEYLRDCILFNSSASFRHPAKVMRSIAVLVAVVRMVAFSFASKAPVFVYYSGCISRHFPCYKLVWCIEKIEFVVSLFIRFLSLVCSDTSRYMPGNSRALSLRKGKFCRSHLLRESKLTSLIYSN